MNTTTAPVSTAKTPNKFVSFLDKVGHDFKVGFSKVMPIVEGAGEAAVTIFDPALSPIFNQTVSAVITAEQSAAAVGQQSGTGPQKLASVVSFMGPLISQALADAGKSSDNAAVQKYVSAIVTILNAIPVPAPASTATAATAATVSSEATSLPSAGPAAPTSGASGASEILG